MDVFDLYAKITLDSKDYDKELGDAKSKFEKFGEGLKGAVGKIGDVLAGIGKAAAVGVGAASTALVGLTKQSLDAVANYEQLVGGVDKIFGEASKKVQEYADEAYMSAGLSSNQYMEVVTGFSASLIQGLKGDTEQAAEIANMAIKDMADNANTYGTAFENVQSNYQALAKQNYTLLDNLKLGYGGTKAEMARLLNDANKIDSTILGEGVEVGEKFTSDEVSFDQMIRAIHTIQEELKITGTTSKEASGTIQGSVASMKAAWQNFLTGTGTPEQFTKILSNSIDNIKKNLNKIIPRLTEGITQLVDLLAPEIPPIIEDTLPAIISGASTLVTEFAKKLPELLTAILPALSEGVVDVSVALVEVMPELITSMKKSIPIIVETIMSKKDDLLKAGKDIIDALLPDNFDNLPELVTSATGFITTFLAKLTEPKNIQAFNDKAFELIGKLVDGLTSEKALSQLTDPETGVFKIVDNLGQGLVDFADHLLEGIGGLLDNFVEFLSKPENIERIEKGATDIVTHLGEGLTSQESKDAIGHFLVSFCQFVGSMIAAGGGGANAIDWEEDVGKEIAWKIARGMWENLKDFLMMPAKIGENLADWVASAILGEETVMYAEEDEKDMEQYVRSGTSLQYDEWKEKEKKRKEDANKFETYYEELSNPNVPDFVKEQMRKAHATGFDVKQPAVLGDHIVGEAGEEVLLPLDSNTGWMDKFATKLDRLLENEPTVYQSDNSFMLGRIENLVSSIDDKFGDIGITADHAASTEWIDKLVDRLDERRNGDIYITVNAQSDKAEDIVSTLDEAFRNRQILQDRSVGGTGWK